LTDKRRWLERSVVGEGPHRVEPPVRCPCAQMCREEYEGMIAAAHEYIAAGDIYQVNLSQRFDAALPYRYRTDLFDRWTRDYAMPFAAFVEAGSWSLASNSPECFLTIDGDRITTHPIKGTRRVDGDHDGPWAARQLSSDPKERAEHVMIVDLERNDLGRVCVPGSVEVSEFLEVQEFPVLSHMISEVRGRLKPGTSAAQIIRATFPGGSITGAPKVRAMQIIEELEPTPRGFYTGAIGWSTLDGRSRFSLAIRTAFLDELGLRYHAGGGIVADSDAAREYEETFLKSESLFRALVNEESGQR
jgi:anthranilate/para-aminobenzoate synthase component I